MITVNSREDFLKVLKGYLPSNPFCVELGVLNGAFSQMILDIVNPETLVLVDPFVVNDEHKYNSGLPTAYSTDVDYINVLKRFETEIGNQKVYVERMYSYEVIDWYKNKSIDFVYHDASHLYHHLKHDLNRWAEKIKESGFVCGHDYIDIEGFGVIQAVNEFMEEQGFEMILFNEQGGDYALRKI